MDQPPPEQSPDQQPPIPGPAPELPRYPTGGAGSGQYGPPSNPYYGYANPRGAGYGPGQSYPPYGQPAYGQPPYGQPPYGQPYGYPAYGYPGGFGQPYGAPVGTNGMAKASFVLGIVGFFGITATLGVVFGCLALPPTKHNGQRGRGLAVTGLVLSGAWIALFATLIVVGVATAQDPAVRDSKGAVVQAGKVALFDLHPGDCFTDPNAWHAATPKALNSVTAKPCKSPHNAEAFATPPARGQSPDGAVTSSSDPYPGMETLETDARESCKTALAGYVYDNLSLPRNVRTVFYVPQPEAWASGNRHFLCSLESPTSLTRSLREDDTVLNADQARYLKAVGEFDRQVRLINETDPKADLATWRRLSADMAVIASRENTALAGTWPPDAQRGVTALIAKQVKAIPLYELGSKGATVDDVQAALGRAMTYVDSDDALTVRSALGLSTIQGQAPNTSAEILYG